MSSRDDEPGPPPAGLPPQFMRPEAADDAAPEPAPIATTAPIETAAIVGSAPEPPRPPPPPPPRPTMIASPADEPEPDDDDDDTDRDRDREHSPGRRKLVFASAATLVLGVGAAAMILLGRVNSERLVLTCEARQVIAERGRAFPPWGERRIEGDEWNPIPIPADFVCEGGEYASLVELGDHFRGKLIERADAMLIAGESAKIDDAAALLEQALLLARLDSDAHQEARKEINRRQGDVGYWRATAKVKEAAAALGEAAKQFDAAALQQPRYVKDASRWAELTRQAGAALAGGPDGLEAKPDAPLPATPERPSAPVGRELPVEPAGSATGSAAGSAAPPAPTVTQPIDAGVPTGGVLL